ncbi:MAG: tyrosine-type recombinase/integrase, partial [Labilithrix sp.]|nr:tyrosine-type recombinase/integrase [Labilithrix sp.]
DVADLWTSGDLAKLHPDHVEAKKTAAIDKSRLKVIKELVGPVAIADAGWLDHAERVMRNLPARCKTSTTRRHYAQLIHRVLALGVWPLRLISHHPLPRGFMPKIGGQKAKVYLYPEEERALMACKDVPLWRRVLWGLLAREGLREGELLLLTWSCLDLTRGVLTLDDNKTDDPRAWAMNPGIVRALNAWRKLHPKPQPSARALGGERGNPRWEAVRSNLPRRPQGRAHRARRALCEGKEPPSHPRPRSPWNFRHAVPRERQDRGMGPGSDRSHLVGDDQPLPAHRPHRIGARLG